MDLLLNAQATLIFMVANVAISVFAFGNAALMNWGLLTTRGVLKDQEYHRVLVSGFLHADPAHLFVNMFTLFFFGPYMELLLGSQHFYIVYLGALVIGSVVALYFNRDNPNYAALGASGAVSGVLFSYCLFEPLNLLFLFGVVPIPAIVFAIGYTLYSIFGMTQANSRIGHEAHLGGAVGGVLITILLRPDALTRFTTELGNLIR